MNAQKWGKQVWNDIFQFIANKKVHGLKDSVLFTDLNHDIGFIFDVTKDERHTISFIEERLKTSQRPANDDNDGDYTTTYDYQIKQLSQESWKRTYVVESTYVSIKTDYIIYQPVQHNFEKSRLYSEGFNGVGE